MRVKNRRLRLGTKPQTWPQQCAPAAARSVWVSRVEVHASGQTSTNPNPTNLEELVWWRPLSPLSPRESEQRSTTQHARNRRRRHISRRGAKKRQSTQHAAAWLWAVWQQPSSEPATKPAPSVPRVLCETHTSSRRTAVPSTHLSNPPPTLARLGHRRGVPPMQEWAVAAARSACHGCRTPGHSHRPRQGPLGRAECTLRARTVSARSKFSLSEPGLYSEALWLVTTKNSTRSLGLS